MSIFKPRNILSALLRPAVDKHGRAKTHRGADAIDNIERLYRLKKRGAISETEFAGLKEKLKQQI